MIKKFKIKKAVGKTILLISFGFLFIFLITLLKIDDRVKCVECNVILISLDTLRADHLGAYGYFRNTSPNIDKIAKDSIFFENAITQASWTLPSHMAIFSSVYPTSAIPYTENVPPDEKSIGFGLEIFSKRYQNLTNIAEILKTKGYVTAGFSAGGFMYPDFGWKKGFETYEIVGKEYRINKSVDFRVQKEDRDAKVVNDAAFKWLEENNEKKFFLFLHYMDIHCPYIPPEEFDIFYPDYNGSIKNFRGKCDAQSFDLKPNVSSFDDDIRRIKSKYDASILYADYHIGELERKLNELDLKNKTIIIILSDHGEEIGDHTLSEFHNFSQRDVYIGHSNSLFNEVIHVPLIIRHPNLGGIRVTQHVRLIDVAPTILDFLAIGKPAYFEGRTLVTLIDQSDNLDRDAFTVSTKSKDRPYGAFSLVSNNSKYIFLYYRTFGNSLELLYDIKNDPKEKSDILSNRLLEAARMHYLLFDWLELTRKIGEALQSGIKNTENEYEESRQRVLDELKNLGYVG